MMEDIRGKDRNMYTPAVIIHDQNTRVKSKKNSIRASWLLADKTDAVLRRLVCTNTIAHPCGYRQCYFGLLTNMHIRV